MHKPLLILLLIVFALGVQAGLAQKIGIKNVPQQLQADSAAVKVRPLDQKKLDGYAKDPDFKYYTKNYKVTESGWDRFWRWFWNWLSSLFPSRPGAMSSTVKYVLIAIAVAGLVFIIFKLMKSDLVNMFSRDSRQITLPYSESLENIHEISFDEEIEKALANRNYKLAVRLLYLSSLKQLNDRNLINWKIDKTNSAYINELADTGKRQSFSVLTRQFEYIWYGDFPVDATSFQNIQTLFTDFKKQLA